MTGSRRLILLGILVTMSWTVFVYYLNALGRENALSAMHKQALIQAKIAFDKDITYRRWAARLGGVYAEVTDTLVPNPYLEVPERDVVTQSGKSLTLINPAYMTRMVHAILDEGSGLKAHITSLNPIRPENEATPWEKKAMESFLHGADEAYEEGTEEGKPVLRFMRPMITEKPCLKCHAKQGYKEGEIRGGISVTVPLEPYRQSLATAMVGDRKHHLVILFAGFCFIAFSSGVLLMNERLRNKAARQAVEAERTLRASEDRYRLYVDNAPSAIFIADKQGRYVDANPMASAVTGYGKSELLKLSIPDLLSESARKQGETIFTEVVEAGKGMGTLPYRTKGGEERWWEVSAVKLSDDRFLSFANDITARKRAEDAIADSLREKDVLLREIHHRVKNNLQVISSLFTLQEEGVDNPDALRILADSRGRVMSMALIHDQLYRGDEFSGIDAGKYLAELCPKLVAAYKGQRDISVRLHVPSIRLVLDQAIPLGLIVNELMTNALKHAFKGRARGEISVTASLSDGVATLQFQDDGVGLPEGFSPDTTTSLGLQIVAVLAKQLHGEFTVQLSAGACFRLAFPVRLSSPLPQ
ncbi:MAG: two-component hybrid sensor and [Desulfovibrionaceae bacterium]|nr:MAG: two-component hybrid sensor and [Desulfovibrionaceae bacterium]